MLIINNHFNLNLSSLRLHSWNSQESSKAKNWHGQFYPWGGKFFRKIHHLLFYLEIAWGKQNFRRNSNPSYSPGDLGGGEWVTFWAGWQKCKGFCQKCNSHILGRLKKTLRIYVSIAFGNIIWTHFRWFWGHSVNARRCSCCDGILLLEKILSEFSKNAIESKKLYNYSYFKSKNSF